MSENIKGILIKLDKSAMIDGQFPIAKESHEQHMMRHIEEFSISQALTEIRKLVRGCVPEKKDWMAPMDYEDDMYIHRAIGYLYEDDMDVHRATGYNEAIDQINKNLKEIGL